MEVHDLTIVNNHDPSIQVDKLKIRNTLLLKRRLRTLKGIKFNVGLDIEFIKNNDGNEEKQIFNMIEKVITITHKSEISGSLDRAKEQLGRRMDRLTAGGSGWRVHRITRHYLNINKYKPLRARGFIALPASINNKKATINIKNNDDRCFIYCLGRRFDPKPEKAHLERVNKHLRKVCNVLGYDQIKTPVTTKDIPNIEKQFDISINLFGHNDRDIYPIKLT